MRCALHDLAAAPDGQCVLCRRAATQRAPVDPWVVLGAVAAVLGVCVVYRAAAAWMSRPDPAAGDAAPQTAARSEHGAVNVVVYTTRWCSVCRRAKQWMSERGIAYEERDVEASTENARHMRSINPRGSVPTFDLDGQVLVGFSEREVESALRKAADRSGARLPR